MPPRHAAFRRAPHRCRGRQRRPLWCYWRRGRWGPHQQPARFHLQRWRRSALSSPDRSRQPCWVEPPGEQRRCRRQAVPRQQQRVRVVACRRPPDVAAATIPGDGDDGGCCSPLCGRGGLALSAPPQVRGRERRRSWRAVGDPTRLSEAATARSGASEGRSLPESLPGRRAPSRRMRRRWRSQRSPSSIQRRGTYVRT